MIENVQSLSEEQYALERRKGLGASDASVFLDLMTKFKKDTAGLIQEKCRTYITEEEKEIGMKESVRKGHDLEDLILTKAAKLLGIEKPLKPKHMYQITDAPYLTVNFDGVSFIEDGGYYIPVESKFVTPYGDKYYNRSCAVLREFPDGKQRPVHSATYDPKDHVDMITAKAATVGIPPYYYPQVTQQILALNAPYGYLVALHDKGWELCVYKVMRDEDTIKHLKIKGFQTMEKIKRAKQ